MAASRRLSVSAAALTRALQAVLPHAALDSAQSFVRSNPRMGIPTCAEWHSAPGTGQGSDGASDGNAEESAIALRAGSLQGWAAADQNSYSSTGTRCT